jgi:hypothetical protein
MYLSREAGEKRGKYILSFSGACFPKSPFYDVEKRIILFMNLAFSPSARAMLVSLLGFLGDSFFR